MISWSICYLEGRFQFLISIKFQQNVKTKEKRYNSDAFKVIKPNTHIIWCICMLFKPLILILLFRCRHNSPCLLQQQLISNGINIHKMTQPLLQQVLDINNSSQTALRHTTLHPLKSLSPSQRAHPTVQNSSYQSYYCISDSSTDETLELFQSLYQLSLISILYYVYHSNKSMPKQKAKQVHIGSSCSWCLNQRVFDEVDGNFSNRPILAVEQPISKVFLAIKEFFSYMGDFKGGLLLNFRKEWRKTRINSVPNSSKSEPNDQIMKSRPGFLRDQSDNIFKKAKKRLTEIDSLSSKQNQNKGLASMTQKELGYLQAIYHNQPQAGLFIKSTLEFKVISSQKIISSLLALTSQSSLGGQNLNIFLLKSYFKGLLLNTEPTLSLVSYLHFVSIVNSRFVKYNHREMGRIIIIFLCIPYPSNYWCVWVDQ